MGKDARTSDFESDDGLPPVRFPDWWSEEQIEELKKDPGKYGAYVARQDIATIRENLRKYRAQREAASGE